MHGEREQTPRGAPRFFWGWLILASLFSMAANVTHAMLLADDRWRWLTAAAALIPPSVLIAATHSVKLLVGTRTAGWAYPCALAMTVVIGLFAFVLSFDAIRSVATMLGFTGRIFGMPVAAIFPLAIDVSIAHATVCLLSQSPPPAGETTRADPRPGPGERPQGTAAPPAREAGESCCAATDPLPAAMKAAGAEVDPAMNGEVTPWPGGAVVAGGVGRGSERYLPLAQTLVRRKITKKDPQLVAHLLADAAAGLSPNVIADQRNVHHSVVTRVMRAARQQAG
jgi:hypothetical protein